MKLISAMPEVKLTKVLNQSYQDQKNTAESILNGKIGKWLCPPQRRTNNLEAVFLLSRSSVITGIHIGNCGSAFVTVNVTHYGSTDFETLLPSSMLLDRQQSKTGSNISSVKMFSRDDFCENVKDKKWGVIRIVCSQPFETHMQFGLSFVHVFSLESGSSFVVDKGKENILMTERKNRYNGILSDSPRPHLVSKIAGTSNRSLQLVTACMNLQETGQSDVKQKTSVTKELNTQQFFGKNSHKADYKGNSLENKSEEFSRCCICNEFIRASELVDHASDCTSSPKKLSEKNEDKEVVCPVCNERFDATTILAHADACAEQSLERPSQPEPVSSTPLSVQNHIQKCLTINEDNVKKTPRATGEKDDITFRKLVISFLESEDLHKKARSTTLGDLRRKFEQSIGDVLDRPKIRKFAAIVRSFISRKQTDSDVNSTEMNGNDDLRLKAPVCRRNILSLADTSLAEESEKSDDVFVRNVIVHHSPQTAEEEDCISRTPKRKSSENGYFRTKRKYNGTRVIDISDDDDDDDDFIVQQNGSLSPSISAHMIQCHLCEGLFNIEDIGYHSSNCIVSADRFITDADCEACPICGVLVKMKNIAEHADSCAQNKFG